MSQLGYMFMAVGAEAYQAGSVPHAWLTHSLRHYYSCLLVQ